MVIPALQGSLVDSLFPRPASPFQKIESQPQSVTNPVLDKVFLSDSGRQLAHHYQPGVENTELVYGLIPVDRRPTAEQSADVILGFISLHLQTLEQRGASKDEMEQALAQALKGFQQGLGEAMDIISGFGMMTDDVSAGIAVTEQLVLEDLADLRDNYLGEKPSPQQTADVNSVVTAYSEQRTEMASFTRVGDAGTRAGASYAISVAASSYAASYQRNETVDLQVRTQDGDIVTISFSSQLASQNSSLLGVASGSQGAAAVLAYQQNTSTSSNFSFSVEGYLDDGEQEALTSLLRQVGELSDEFFNGDFDTAFAMALDFKMDTAEFSALSLDLARSSRANIVETYTSVNNVRQHSDAGLPVLLERLVVMMDRANAFAEPEQLISDLLSNQLAQQLMLMKPTELIA